MQGSWCVLKNRGNRLSFHLCMSSVGQLPICRGKRKKRRKLHIKEKKIWSWLHEIFPDKSHLWSRGVFVLIRRGKTFFFFYHTSPQSLLGFVKCFRQSVITLLYLSYFSNAVIVRQNAAGTSSAFWAPKALLTSLQHKYK